jgi:hypothetical protein
LKDHGLITRQAFILMKAANRFAHPPTAPNQLWWTDFTYLKVIGWGRHEAELFHLDVNDVGGRRSRCNNENEGAERSASKMASKTHGAGPYFNSAATCSACC